MMSGEPDGLAYDILRDEISAWSRRPGADALPGLADAIETARQRYAAGSTIGDAVNAAKDVYRRSDRRRRLRPDRRSNLRSESDRRGSLRH